MRSTGHAREFAFERLRNQFEHRRHEKANWLAKHIADVDIEDFTHDPAQGQGHNNTVSFELCGALPPTVRHYGRDVASWVAIGHAERQAAKELIERQKSADKAAIEALHNSARSPRNLEKPSSSGGLGQRLRSTWLDTDLQQSLDDFSPEQSQIQAKSSSATASQQPCFTGAAAESWEGLLCTSDFYTEEHRIIDFYRRWEARRNEEYCLEAKEEQLEKDRHRRDAVRAISFETAHVKREEAIRNEAKRLDIRMSHREYKKKMEEELERQASERKNHLSKVQEAYRKEKEKADVKRSARDIANGFISQGLSLEKTCRRIDLWKGRVQEHTVASGKIAEEKVQRLAHSARHASYRALCEAQKRKVETELKRKDAYLMKLAKERVQHDAAEIRHHVAEERELEMHLRDKRAQFEQITSESKKTNDASGYERTLNALKDLAEGVRAHGVMMQEVLHEPAQMIQSEDYDEDGDIIPLLDTEPRVRAVLGHTSAKDHLEALFPNLPEDEDEHPEEAARFEETVENYDMWDETPTIASPRGRSAMFGETPSTRAPTQTPKTPSRPCSRRKSPSPLLVRPMIDLRQQASGHISAVPKKGKRGDTVQSLAALRMIRRTGPLIKR